MLHVRYTYESRHLIMPSTMRSDVKKISTTRCQEVADGQVKGGGEFFQVIDADVPLRAFDAADVSAV